MVPILIHFTAVAIQDLFKMFRLLRIVKSYFSGVHKGLLIQGCKSRFCATLWLLILFEFWHLPAGNSLILSAESHMCLKKTDYEGRLILPYFSFFVLIMCGNLFELVLTYLIFSLIHLGTSSLLQFRIWYRRAPVMTQASSRLFVFPLQFPAEAIWHIGPAPFYRPASLNLTLTAWTVCGRSLCLRDRESRSVDKSYCLESPNLVLVTPDSQTAVAVKKCCY